MSPTVVCPGCAGEVTPAGAATGWQDCPYCGRRLQIRAWPSLRQTAEAVAAKADQATCFYHPDKAFHACCQRCGRFVCGLCDLQLGAEHLCPSCFERGRSDEAGAEWRDRDVLYDSIAVTLGWGWILFWPTVLAALPISIYLHAKHGTAPRTYLIPRSGWRFWVAYGGFLWPGLLLTLAFMSIRRIR